MGLAIQSSPSNCILWVCKWGLYGMHIKASIWFCCSLTFEWSIFVVFNDTLNYVITFILSWFFVSSVWNLIALLFCGNASLSLQNQDVFTLLQKQFCFKPRTVPQLTHTEGITKESDRLIIFFYVFNSNELVLEHILVNSGFSSRFSWGK